MSSIREKVLHVIEMMTSVPEVEISDEMTLNSLKLDSADIVEMMIALTDEFETLIDDSRVSGTPAEVGAVTVGQLIALFEEQVDT